MKKICKERGRREDNGSGNEGEIKVFLRARYLHTGGKLVTYATYVILAFHPGTYGGDQIYV